MAGVQDNSYGDTLLDITDFPRDWDDIDLPRLSILDAIAHVLRDSHSRWRVEMLSLRRYYRVRFRRRNTIHDFLDYMLIVADNKENQHYSPQNLVVMKKIMRDITEWIIERRSCCIDDSHWPIDEEHVTSYRKIYATFDFFMDERYMLADSYFCTILEQKRLVDDAFAVNKANGILDVVTEVEMYTDGNLVPPPLESDYEITSVNTV